MCDITDPLRERAQHEILWIFSGGEHGSGWEHVSRRGCGLFVGHSRHLQVVFFLSYTLIG